MEKASISPFIVRAADCDIRARMRMDALFVQMQEGAEVNASSHGASREDLLKRGLFFALVRTSVHVSRMPRAKERILHKTWPGAANRFFFPRYHVFSSESGEELACASSLWVTLNRETRHIVSPPESGLCFPDTSEISPPLPLPTRLPSVQGDSISEGSRIPAYSDFDLNGHVNNTRYISWLCDMLGRERLDHAVIQDLTCGYEKEIPDTQPVKLRLVQQENRFGFQVLSDEDARHFQASLTLQEEPYV